AFEHQCGGAVGQRAVDDVAVAGDPADVGGAPVDVTVLIVEHVFVRHGAAKQIAASGVQHALRFAGGAGGVKNKQRVFRTHRFWWAVSARGVHGLVVPDVTFFIPVHLATGAAHGDAGVYARAMGQRLVGVGFQ